MEKVWFICIDGKREGPFSVQDLKRDHRLSPDTLVWKEGFSKWKKIRHVPELKEVFFDEKTDQDNLIEKAQLIVTPRDEIILDLQKEPPYLFWLLIALLLLLYATFQFFWLR